MCSWKQRETQHATCPQFCVCVLNSDHIVDSDDWKEISVSASGRDASSRCCEVCSLSSCVSVRIICPLHSMEEHFSHIQVTVTGKVKVIAAN